MKIEPSACNSLRYIEPARLCSRPGESAPGPWQDLFVLPPQLPVIAVLSVVAMLV